MLEGLKRIKERIYNQVQEKSITTGLKDKDVELIVNYIRKSESNDSMGLGVITEICKGLYEVFDVISDYWSKHKENINNCNQVNKYYKDVKLISQVVTAVEDFNIHDNKATCIEKLKNELVSQFVELASKPLKETAREIRTKVQQPDADVMNKENIKLINNYVDNVTEKIKKDEVSEEVKKGLESLKSIYKNLHEIATKLSEDWDSNKNELNKRFNLHCKNLELILEVVPSIVKLNENLPDKCKIISSDEVESSDAIRSLIGKMRFRDSLFSEFVEPKISELEGKTHEAERAVVRFYQINLQHEDEKKKLSDKNKTLSNENRKMREEKYALSAKLDDANREISRRSDNISRLEDEKRGLTRCNTQLQTQNSNLNEQNKKFSDVKAQSKKQVSYAFTSFALSVASIGVCLAVSYLAVCVVLTILSLIFFAVGCTYLRNASTELDNIEIVYTTQSQSI